MQQKAEAQEIMNHMPPFINVPKGEQPIFTGYSKNFRPESTTFDHLLADVNADGFVDNVLLPHLPLSAELDGSKQISTYLGTKGGSIKIDPIISDIESSMGKPLIRSQGVLSNFVQQDPYNDLVMASIKADLYVSVRMKADYVFTLSRLGKFQIFYYLEQLTNSELLPIGYLDLGGEASTNSLDIDYDNRIAVAVTTTGLHIISIQDFNNPQKTYTIQAETYSFRKVCVSNQSGVGTFAYAIESIVGFPVDTVTLLRIFNISDVNNPFEISRIEYKNWAGSSINYNEVTKTVAIGFYQTDADPSRGLISLVNVENPGNPISFDSLVGYPGWISDVHHIKISATQRLYFVSKRGDDSSYLYIYDIVDNYLKFITYVEIDVIPESIYVDYQFRVYITGLAKIMFSAKKATLLKLSVANDVVEELCRYTFGRGNAFETDVSLNGMRAFVAANAAGIWAFNVFQPQSCLYLTKYQLKNV